MLGCYTFLNILFVYSYLESVSCWPCIVWSSLFFFFLIHYDKLCLLIGMLKQFKFIMIMNMVRFESIFLLFVFYFSLLFCTLFLSILLFFWITWEMFYDSILCPLLAHAMGWILSLPNLYVEAPSPNVTVFGDKAFMEVIRVRWGPNSGSLIQ